MPAGARQKAFSVAEVLIAVGLLAVAMIFIAGVFPVGIRFTQVSIDRTTAAIVANEAFAKIRLYANAVTGTDDAKTTELSFTRQRDFNDWFDSLITSPGADDYIVDVNTFSYPTDNTIHFDDKQYCWSALLRRTDRLNDPNVPDSSRAVQVTVFVYRKPHTGTKYLQANFDPMDFGNDGYGRIVFQTGRLPQPVRIEVDEVTDRDNELEIEYNFEKTFINDGDIIVDDPTGRIYRVMERYPVPADNIIRLDKDFIWDDWRGRTIRGDRYVWVVAPQSQQINERNGYERSNPFGRNPCVGIYQKVIRF